MTGEAVVLELRLARLPSRALAFAIDLAIMSTALVLLLTILFQALLDVDGALLAAVTLILVLGTYVGYPVIMETLTRGRTVGKLALGLRVVREDGGPIRFRHAFARGLAGFIVDFGVFSLFTGAVGLISSLASAKGKRVGDVLAGTVVLRERVPVQNRPPVAMPGPLAHWASGLELSRLPDDLALQARQFLLRAPDLDPAIRATMGQDLAAGLGAHVSPGPPPGTPPEAFVSAVLAERRRREGARLAAQHLRQQPGRPHQGPPPYLGPPAAPYPSPQGPYPGPPGPYPGPPAQPSPWAAPTAPAASAPGPPGAVDDGFAPPR